MPPQARPGDLVLLVVRGAEAAPEGTLCGRPLRFWQAGETWQALAPLPIETATGPAPLVLRAGGEPVEAALEIVPATFRVSTLKVPPRFVEPPASAKARIKEDQAAIAKAYDQPFGPPRFSGAFAWPRLAELNSFYGDQRTYNGVKSDVHYGLDIDGAAGDPVAAAADGVVVLARDCYMSGNTVILSHGAGLFTSYLHQSKLLVKAGDAVKQGQRLGLVGSTGRSTGPHLHWGVKVDGLWVDPQAMLRLDVTAAATVVSIPAPAPRPEAPKAPPKKAPAKTLPQKAGT